MDSYQVIVSSSSKWTRLLLSHGADEFVRAILPPASQVRHERAMPTLLEGMSMLLDSPLCVVLSAADEDFGYRLGLTDEMGLGLRSLFYRVEVTERVHRRRRGRRISGIGDFGDLRQQLRLLPLGAAR